MRQVRFRWDSPCPIPSKISGSVHVTSKQNIYIYFMLSGRISRNIGENIFRSYSGSTNENTGFNVFVS